MSGVGIGAFAQGLAGGVSMAKSLKDMKKKPDAPKTPAAPEQPSFGLDQQMVTGDVGNAQYAGDGSWNMLGGILDGLNMQNTGS